MRNLEGESFIEKLISNEIEGKNKAIHAYDAMMWTVRTGYLTIVFGGWGLMAKSLFESNQNLYDSEVLIFIVIAFTVTLSMGAFVIDRNYVKRKFRVICVLNNLIEIAVKQTSELDSDNVRSELKMMLQIAGDKDDDKFTSPGYNVELSIVKLVYITPLIPIALLGFYLVCLS